ncbi:hypothetical protein TVAG_412980 [Trichomonas vaginalis G3]|uniref:Uncharacterized protein n=1 Tax=Trichomonas vaginalis (strain ATCC PRA-98 / G3) TaxID=412133 RepID=A2F6I3_TRIV3|nr:hypothetical protein TVAGG3_0002210 [Trichomonas vaginalis G3]EAX99481.1 hypothetical protein TVAG_412980 [Trichomonas vaginalis G3]KAI5538694.1 hypothetical protein TVAGG3_0002210 [Trichomonas vaginalis G3]|eukprot:XP_001312411.1 hypothetical protein [Trichomonas vaginalis G3]
MNGATLAILVATFLAIVIVLWVANCTGCFKSKPAVEEVIASEPLVTVSPVVVSNSVIYTNPNHTPLLQPNQYPSNGPLIIDQNAPPLPTSVAFESADFPSVTQKAQTTMQSTEFPSVTPNMQ